MAQATSGARMAEVQGELWGTDPPRWAVAEEQQRPVYEEVAERLGVGGLALLDVGCGTGVAMRVAADRGAAVTGIDASAPLVEIARTRVPEADSRLGDLEELPFEDATFDVVTGFNSYQFASDMTAALRESARVVRPGGRVVVQVWGRAERTDLMAMVGAVTPLLPEPPPSGPGGRALCEPGVLEGLVTAAGLTPTATGDVVFELVFPDEESMLGTMLAAGVVVLAARIAGKETVRTAIAEAVAPFRTADGGYRFENEWHYLIAAR